MTLELNDIYQNSYLSEEIETLDASQEHYLADMSYLKKVVAKSTHDICASSIPPIPQSRMPASFRSHSFVPSHKTSHVTASIRPHSIVPTRIPSHSGAFTIIVSKIAHTLHTLGPQSGVKRVTFSFIPHTYSIHSSRTNSINNETYNMETLQQVVDTLKKKVIEII